MLGFQPLSSAPLADDGGTINRELVASNITSSNPSIGSASFIQIHALTPNGITLGAVSIPTTNMAEQETFDADDCIMGAPSLGSPAFTQKHVFLADGITGGVNVFETPAMIVNVNLGTPSSITLGVPLVNQTLFGQGHTFLPSPIVTQNIIIDNITIAQNE